MAVQEIAFGSGTDFMRIYYTIAESGEGHNVTFSASYYKSAGSTDFSAKSDCYLQVNGVTTWGQAARRTGAGETAAISSNTAYVSHHAATTVTLYYKIYGLKAGYSGGYIESSFSISLPKVTETAPGAPSSLSVSPSGIVVPGATISFSWTAGSAGTNNPIVGYTVYGCNTGIATASNVRSWTAIAPSSRGSTYGSSVITRGTYSNSGSRAGNSIQINRLPNNPTISGSDVTIDATAAAPTFTVSRTGTDPDGQTVTLYYNWSNSHTGQTAIAHGGSITIDPERSTAGNTTKTLYVWAWDGLEYSSVVTRTVTRRKFTPINFNGVLAERTIFNGVEVQHLNFNGEDIF